MSGCYDNYSEYCGYEQSWDYNDCHRPRHCKPRHRRHHYNDCWEYGPVA